MADRTLVKGTWVVAYDGRQHRILKDGVVVYEENTILHVGKQFDGRVDRVIDATGKVVTPGFISTHGHVTYAPIAKSYIGDVSDPRFYNSSTFYQQLPVQMLAQDEEADLASIDLSLVEHIRSGCTTFVELPIAMNPRSTPEPTIERTLAAGLRMYIARPFRCAFFHSPDGQQIVYDWDEEAGREGLRRSVEFVEQWDGVGNGRIRGYLEPAHAEDTSEELLREVHRLADEMDVPLTIHVSEAVLEFQEMLRRHGKTPIAWLRDIGFLTPRVFLGHVLIIGGSSWTNYPPGDIQIMASSGVSVSHNPWNHGRRGLAMESFQRYLDAGINMSLGTDGSPQSMLVNMRSAAVVGKIVDRLADVATAAEVFNAATLGGARALGRDDLGRLAPGAKADLVIWDAESINMAPVRDPIKNLVYYAEHSDVEGVVVDGRVVMENRQMTWSQTDRDVARRLQTAGEATRVRMQEHDRAKRSIDQISPPAFPDWD
ncbi:MAG: amidohydrolase family protein [Chloroflexi bacterium]|nr:amidohydrolase family protein [Chloroflexota bacterium]